MKVLITKVERLERIARHRTDADCTITGCNFYCSPVEIRKQLPFTLPPPGLCGFIQNSKAEAQFGLCGGGVQKVSNIRCRKALL